MNERLKFVAAHQRGDLPMSQLCEDFGISRKTGYKILARYHESGPEGLRDRSRAPLSHPNQSSTEVETEVLRVRKAHPTWGSKKILAVLNREQSTDDLPARSTVDAILKRAGLVEPRRARARKQPPSAPPIVDALKPNDCWSIDFKGWFKVGDGTRCDPLTINDVCSRASLECRAMVSPKLEDVKKRMRFTFECFGLPSNLLSDNGPPFASRGLGRLSRLGVWLLRLGVQPVLIQPGRPDQNGRHERFHETLKAETANPPRVSVRAQQAAFDRFQPVYNEERPHEALGMKVPADIYELSPRSMPTVLPSHEYLSEDAVRRVRGDGSIKWKSDLYFVGEAMRGEDVALREIDEKWQLFLGTMRLGVLHPGTRMIIPYRTN